jgi:hypothetical protein
MLRIKLLGSPQTAETVKIPLFDTYIRTGAATPAKAGNARKNLIQIMFGESTRVLGA